MLGREPAVLRKGGSQMELGNFECGIEVAGCELVYEWNVKRQNRRCLRGVLTFF
jgi:hypothetical protein